MIICNLIMKYIPKTKNINMFYACKPGYESMLVRELALYGISSKITGDGWVIANSFFPEHVSGNPFSPGPCFSPMVLEDPTEIATHSLKSLATKLVDFFLESLKRKRISSSWPAIFTAASTREKLPKRIKTVETLWFETLRKKISRVAKLATKEIAHDSIWVEGFFVYFVDFNRVFASLKGFFGGQRRMQMDPSAPSRSYLKIEEAYRIIGCEPKKNQKVVDFGASPGGWSYSALKRGAQVIAVDNGPLADTIRSHSHIAHLEEDAFTFRPTQKIPFDWLFCDIIENPDRILTLVKVWLKNYWCRNFVINFKTGRTDPIPLLKKILNNKDGLLPYCSLLKIRQLYHDREEFTVVGKRN